MRCRWMQSSVVLAQNAPLHSYGDFQNCCSELSDQSNRGGGTHQKEKQMACCVSCKKMYTEHSDEELDACFKRQRDLLLVAAIWRMTRPDCPACGKRILNHTQGEFLACMDRLPDSPNYQTAA